MHAGLHTQLSFLIKTFERPMALRRLLQSLQDAGWQCPVLIADDSAHPAKETIMQQFGPLVTDYICLPFDTGISAGRNALLEKVTTPFFVLCDDDIVFEKNTRLRETLAYLEKNHFDIIGGVMYNYESPASLKQWLRLFTSPARLLRWWRKQPVASRYKGHFHCTKDCCTLLLDEEAGGAGPVSVHLVHNFLMARTEAVRAMGGWDEYYKMGEHEDFFFMALKAGLRTAFWEQWGVKHYPASYGNRLSMRLRAAAFKSRFPLKHSFQRYEEKDLGTGKIIFSVPAKDN